jgi:lipid-A-disaccharide synthase
MIIAGEASGDMHAARLVRSTLAVDSQIHFFGIGGNEMRKAGVEILVDASEMAVVGLIEVLKHYRRLSGVLHRMRDILRREPPDLLILVDYPGFNLRLAKSAKQAGVRVLYYISPQVWAWRQKRVHEIRDCVDMMAVVFPFEVEFYREYNVPVTYVGHPLIQELNESAIREPSHNEFGLNPDKPVVGLFPGSRKSELKRLLPVVLASADLIRHHRPDTQFVLPVASTLSYEDLLDHGASKKQLSDICVVSGKSQRVIPLCTLIITASGTVTLEIALRQIPMVIIYKVAFLTFEIVKRLIKIKYIGLCNIIVDKKLVPELIQHDATPEKIYAEVKSILDDSAHAKALHDNLADVRQHLPPPSPGNEIETVVIEMLVNK